MRGEDSRRCSDLVHAADACHLAQTLKQTNHSKLVFYLILLLPLGLSRNFPQCPFPNALMQPMRISDEQPRHPNHTYPIVQQRMRPVWRRRVRPSAARRSTPKPNFRQDRPHVRPRRRNHHRRLTDFGQLRHLNTY